MGNGDRVANAEERELRKHLAHDPDRAIEQEG